MTTKTPNKQRELELVPFQGNAQESSESSGNEKRRKPRINLTTEQFRLQSTQVGPQENRSFHRIFSVEDLSPAGMAFRVLDSNDLLVLPVSTVLNGVLNLRGEKLEVKAQVKNLSPYRVGCEFSELSDSVKSSLEKFLDPAVLGSSLRPIPSSDVGTLWYHGPSGTDLLLGRAIDGKYSRLMLFVLGSFIQWDEQGGLTTGKAKLSDDACDQRSEEWGVVQFETMILTQDAQPDSHKLSIAKAVFMSSNLPQDLKKWCLRQVLPPA